MDDSNNQTDNNSEEIEKLKSLLDMGEQLGDRIANVGREITQYGQKISDTARNIRNVVNVIPLNIPTSPQITMWKDINSRSESYLSTNNENRDMLIYTGGTIAATAAISGSRCIPIPSSTINFDNKNVTEIQIVDSVFIEYLHFMARPEKKSETRNLLEKWGFMNNLPGKKSACALFNTAHEAFENPVNDQNPIVTSLIPMRECLLMVLDGLKQVRPRPDNIRKNETFNSIIEQLGKTNLDIAIISEWESQWEGFKAIFGDSKQSKMERGVWEKHLFETTTLLYALLNSLDISKARKVKPYF